MNIVRRGLRRARRDLRRRWRLREASRLGITFARPVYIYRGPFDADSVVVDVGCAGDPDFSLHFIERFGARCYGVDPTRKHAAALAAVTERTQGRFVHLSKAVAATPGVLTFHESEDNVSGSILEDHYNIIADRTRSYEVEAVTLRGLRESIPHDRCDLLKLDLEGAEYDLLAKVTTEDLRLFGQVFVEFHHHAIRRFTPATTRSVVESIRARGFQAFSLDDHNYLFFG